MNTKILEKKLELAELTLRLEKITKEKWRQLKLHSEILKEEEDLIKEIAERSECLQNMIKKIE